VTSRNARGDGRPAPPAMAAWLLRAVRLEARNDALRGDLLEEFRRRTAVDGSRSARRWYWRETLSLLVRTQGYTKMLTLDHLRQDVRYAWRSYAKAPAFTLLVATTLALGIGASTAIFSIVNGILLKPLAFPEPDRLAWISEATKNGTAITVSWPNFLDWRARQQSFSALSLSRAGAFTMTGSGRATRVTGRTATSNFFDVLGVQPSLGRNFTAADEKPGAQPVAILSHPFWQRQLNGDRGILGRTLTLGGRGYVVVGVLPEGFRYLRDYDLFVSMGAISGDPSLNDRGNHQGFVGVGRLKPGVAFDAAVKEMQGIETSLAEAHPDTVAGQTALVEPLKARLVNEDRATLLVLLGAVGILLLIACVNVANLLIARGASRQHELAVRAALGGRRGRIAAQMLVESTMLSAAGGLFGAALGAILLRVLIAVAPEGTPRLDEVHLDGTALLFAAAAAGVCGVLFGAFPAVQASSVSGQQLVIRTRAAGASAGSHRLRRGLLVAEVALALILLTGAGLMMRTLVGLTGADLGFEPDHLLTLRAVLPSTMDTEAKRVAAAQELLRKTRVVPGVTGAGVGLSLPIDGSNWNSVFVAQDKPVPPTHDLLPTAAMIPASDGFLEALGVHLVRGRLFTAADRQESTPVVVVNEALAAAIWPGEDPIGRRVKQGWPERPGIWREVVGVIRNVRFEGITERMTLQVYMPYAQNASSDIAVLVRTAVTPGSVRPTIEAVLASISGDMPVSAVRTMDDVLRTSIARQRMALLVLGVFAAIALILAGSGLYGLVTHSVTERTHEIGVRMALGAAAGDVVRIVVRQGLAMTALGIAIGVAGAAGLSETLRGLVFGVEPIDPITFGGVVTMLILVSMLACWIPAWRATRIAPVTALRSE